MNIGILGAGGFVGSRIIDVFRARGLHVVKAKRENIDYFQPEDLCEWIERNEIHFLVNSAGFVGKPNVDACEKQKYECLLGNAVLPGSVRLSCEMAGIPFGHISSGCIFQGSKPGGTGFIETDVPNFCFRAGTCSFYSGCKALGEEVLSGCKNCYIWRLRIPFNHVDSSRNYLSKLLRYETLLDVQNSLSHLDEFAACCAACIVRGLPFGIYNLTNPGSVTTREVVQMLREFIAKDREFKFFKDEDEFMRRAAVAPRSSCVLDSSKALDAGLSLRPIRDALHISLRNWQPEHATS